MKIIYNSIIPFDGYMAINLFGIFFVRKEYKDEMNNIVINHEAIHTAQMKELCYIFFYIIYLFEWLFKAIKYSNSYRAYREISFEKEAYKHEKELDYLNKRHHYNQWK